ncbi:hypothetical protein [Streptomyces sp. NPDC047928]|uniref:hypothetical protein n=1 Tax=Streptomyces sp. NPDC047928 TaxID=3365492 RepID=UPI0037114FA8
MAHRIWHAVQRTAAFTLLALFCRAVTTVGREPRGRHRRGGYCPLPPRRVVLGDLVLDSPSPLVRPYLTAYERAVG